MVLSSGSRSRNRTLSDWCTYRPTLEDRRLWGVGIFSRRFFAAARRLGEDPKPGQYRERKVRCPGCGKRVPLDARQSKDYPMCDDGMIRGIMPHKVKKA